MGKERISVGVAGAGYIANFAHLPFLYNRSDACLKAICDTNLDRAKETAQRFHIPKVYATIEDMLSNERLKLVNVCLPPYSHMAAIAQVLGHDVNCLVEKPLTLTTADADAAIALAEKRGLKLHVAQSYSALPAVLRAKALVAKGSIGQVRGVHVNHLNVFMDRHLDPNHWCHALAGEYFGEVGPHLAMLVVEFIGPIDEAKVIAIKTSGHESIRLDEFGIVVQGKDAVGTISCSENCPSRVLTIDVWGTDGSVHVNADYQAVVRRGSLDSSMNVWARGQAALGDILSRVRALLSTSFNVLAGRYAAETVGHRYLIEQSIKDLRGEGKYPIDTRLAREAVHLLELAFAKPRNAERPRLTAASTDQPAGPKV